MPFIVLHQGSGSAPPVEDEYFDIDAVLSCAVSLDVWPNSFDIAPAPRIDISFVVDEVHMLDVASFVEARASLFFSEDETVDIAVASSPAFSCTFDLSLAQSDFIVAALNNARCGFEFVQDLTDDFSGLGIVDKLLQPGRFII